MPWSTQTRQQRGYGAQWDKLRKQVLRRDAYLCRPCLADDRLTSATEVDHIVPKAKGGTDTPSNLQAICRACHRAKTTIDGGGVPRQQFTHGADGWPIPTG